MSTRAHQSWGSGGNSREIKVSLFLFTSHSFLANNLCFMVKLIDKAIVINVKIHKNERKGLYSSNKENLWRQKNHGKFLNLYWRNSSSKSNPKSKKQMLPVPNWLFDWVIFFYYFNTTWVISSFFKGKQSTCQVLSMAAF